VAPELQRVGGEKSRSLPDKALGGEIKADEQKKTSPNNSEDIYLTPHKEWEKYPKQFHSHKGKIW